MVCRPTGPLAGHPVGRSRFCTTKKHTSHKMALLGLVLLAPLGGLSYVNGVGDDPRFFANNRFNLR